MQGVGGQDGNYAHNDRCATTPKHPQFEPRPRCSLGCFAPLFGPYHSATPEFNRSPAHPV